MSAAAQTAMWRQSTAGNKIAALLAGYAAHLPRRMTPHVVVRCIVVAQKSKSADGVDIENDDHQQRHPKQPLPIDSDGLAAGELRTRVTSVTDLNRSIKNLVADDDAKAVVYVKIALVEDAEDREEEKEEIKQGHSSERRRVRAVCLRRPQPGITVVEESRNAGFVSIVTALFLKIKRIFTLGRQSKSCEQRTNDFLVVLT